MTEDLKNFEKNKKPVEKLESSRQHPAKARVSPKFAMSDEEMQKLVDAISYVEYDILNDSIIE